MNVKINRHDVHVSLRWGGTRRSPGLNRDALPWKRCGRIHRSVRRRWVRFSREFLCFLAFLELFWFLRLSWRVQRRKKKGRMTGAADPVTHTGAGTSPVWEDLTFTSFLKSPEASSSVALNLLFGDIPCSSPPLSSGGAPEPPALCQGSAKSES